MTITTFSSHQFNQDASKAKKAAMAGPAFITDRGRPTHVLLEAAIGCTVSVKCVGAVEASRFSGSSCAPPPADNQLVAMRESSSSAVVDESCSTGLPPSMSKCCRVSRYASCWPTTPARVRPSWPACSSRNWWRGVKRTRCITCASHSESAQLESHALPM